MSVGAASLGNVMLEPDRKRDLPPGKYGTFSVKSRSTVTLHSGTYVLNDFMLEPQAKLRIDDREGPVQVVVKGNCTYRGQVVSAIGEIPQLLFAVQGTSVMVEAPFTGALVAPNAQVRFQAARPEGHRAFVYGKRVALEPDTRIRRLPFDWTTVVGTNVDPIPPDAIVRSVSEGDLDLSVNIRQDGSGPHSVSRSLPKPEPFRLRERYTIGGGIIGNGTVTFRYRLGTGAWNTCTYKGQSPTSAPTTHAELMKGTLLVLQSCSDGLVPSAWRSGDGFELLVEPSPGYPVIVDSPMLRPEACDDSMELLTPAKTLEMREQFNWSNAQKVAAKNPDGTPTLYYAWIYVQNKNEALALKKLYIHVLSRPLFDEELLQFGGRCGTFTNPGDGNGMFVPVLLPGVTYNKLIDALSSPDVSGDATIFEAVILRSDVPASARNANGSINLNLLKAANFHYLDYEPNPFADPASMTLDLGGSKILTDALAWVGQAARDIGETITGFLGEIDQLFRGDIILTFHMRAITRDTNFGGQPMVRAWGPYAGSPLGATGMQVKVIQKTIGVVPITARGDTNINGKVVIDASNGADSRRSGLCVELRTKAALVTDFLMPNEMCDLRGYIDDGDSETSQEVKRKYDFHFEAEEDGAHKTYDLHFDKTRITGLYQSDDVYRWGKEVIEHTAPTARILSGYWAATFARDGGTRLFTPCLNFPNSLSDLLVAGGAIGGAASGAYIGSIIPAVGTLAGTAVGAAAGAAFGAVVGNSDIVMTLKSDLRYSRGVMSHEYGHYMFCSMLYSENVAAVDHLIWGNIVRGDDTSLPLRYTNEAMAEFFMGQVTSGSNYQWMTDANQSTSLDYYCGDNYNQCWDENLSGSDSGRQNIARVATMLWDAFDGHGDNRKRYVPNDGDAWHHCSEPAPPISCEDTKLNAECGNPDLICNDETFVCECIAPLTYSPTGYLDGDSTSTVGIPDRVHMSGKQMKKIIEVLADELLPFFKYSIDDTEFQAAGHAIDDDKVRKAINDSMAQATANWCDRCIILALHDPSVSALPAVNAKTVFNACNTETDLALALNESPPEPFLRIDASDCSPCGFGEVSNDNGECVPCLVGEVVGNECNQCKSDVILDGATMSFNAAFDTSVVTPGDNCPDTFWVQIDNPVELFNRGDNVDFSATVTARTPNQASCTQPWSLSKGFPDAASGYYAESTVNTNGSFVPCPDDDELCLETCRGVPVRTMTMDEAAAGVVRWGTRAQPGTELRFSAIGDSGPPK